MQQSHGRGIEIFLKTVIIYGQHFPYSNYYFILVYNPHNTGFIMCHLDSVFFLILSSIIIQNKLK